MKRFLCRKKFSGGWKRGEEEGSQRANNYIGKNSKVCLKKYACSQYNLRNFRINGLGLVFPGQFHSFSFIFIYILPKQTLG